MSSNFAAGDWCRTKLVSCPASILSTLVTKSLGDIEGPRVVLDDPIEGSLSEERP
jgi:hypothetical protein